MFVKLRPIKNVNHLHEVEFAQMNSVAKLSIEQFTTACDYDFLNTLASQPSKGKRIVGFGVFAPIAQKGFLR